jgi:hypothetical protein
MSCGIFLLSTMSADTGYGTAVAYIVVTGIGLGTTMPLYVISIQNAVPHHMLGVATASGTFFRAIGGSVGLGVLGSIMNNSFAGQFSRLIPEQVRQVVPTGVLDSLAENPQALVNPDAQAQLQDMLSQAGENAPILFEQLLQALREALSSSLSEVFLIGLFISAAAFFINFLLKEIPLRRTR